MLTENLFDLCLLEEMDDTEYTSDILGIFLKHTPADLMQLHTICIAEYFEDAYNAAHKLKSSSGLIKAEALNCILIRIEQTAKAKTKGLLAELAEQANNEFRKLEFPLQQYLKSMET